MDDDNDDDGTMISFGMYRNHQHPFLRIPLNIPCPPTQSLLRHVPLCPPLQCIPELPSNTQPLSGCRVMGGGQELVLVHGIE